MKDIKIVRGDSVVPLDEMIDGDLAEVVKWHQSQYVGQIIQRYYDIVMFIGRVGGNSYDELLDHPCASDGTCMVRIVQPGDTVTFTK